MIKASFRMCETGLRATGRRAISLAGFLVITNGRIGVITDDNPLPRSGVLSLHSGDGLLLPPGAQPCAHDPAQLLPDGAAVRLRVSRAAVRFQLRSLRRSPLAPLSTCCSISGARRWRRAPLFPSPASSTRRKGQDLGSTSENRLCKSSYWPSSAKPHSALAVIAPPYPALRNRCPWPLVSRQSS